MNDDAKWVRPSFLSLAALFGLIVMVWGLITGAMGGFHIAQPKYGRATSDQGDVAAAFRSVYSPLLSLGASQGEVPPGSEEALARAESDARKAALDRAKDQAYNDTVKGALAFVIGGFVLITGAAGAKRAARSNGSTRSAARPPAPMQAPRPPAAQPAPRQAPVPRAAAPAPPKATPAPPRPTAAPPPPPRAVPVPPKPAPAPSQATTSPVGALQEAPKRPRRAAPAAPKKAAPRPAPAAQPAPPPPPPPAPASEEPQARPGSAPTFRPPAAPSPAAEFKPPAAPGTASKAEEPAKEPEEEEPGT